MNCSKDGNAACSVPGRTRELTVADALDEYLDALVDGSVLSPANRPYKPAAIGSYRRAVETRLKPALGSCKLSELERADVYRMVEKLRRDGRGAGSIHATLEPLRAVYRAAIKRGEVVSDPTAGVGSRLGGTP